SGEGQFRAGRITVIVGLTRTDAVDGVKVDAVQHLESFNILNNFSRGYIIGASGWLIRTDQTPVLNAVPLVAAEPGASLTIQTVIDLNHKNIIQVTITAEINRRTSGNTGNIARKKHEGLHCVRRSRTGLHQITSKV